MSIRRRIADSLELQLDVVMNLPVLHVTGGERLLMENHKGLLEYGKNKIRIASAAGPVEIEGENLNIKSLGRDEVLITGSIKTVNMSQTGVRP